MINKEYNMCKGSIALIKAHSRGYRMHIYLHVYATFKHANHSVFCFVLII